VWIQLISLEARRELRIPHRPPFSAVWQPRYETYSDRRPLALAVTLRCEPLQPVERSLDEGHGWLSKLDWQDMYLESGNV
jgi:hypothetical protein